MAIQIGVSPDIVEHEKQAARSKRIKILFSAFIGVILCRIFIKNPEPPKQAPHPGRVLRPLPGMLSSIPESARFGIDPKSLAQMQLADENLLMTRRQAEVVKLQPYKALDAPLENKADEESYRQELYVYAKRKKLMEMEQRQQKAQDLTKSILVVFHNGGYLKAEDALQTAGETQIRIDKSIVARVPNKIVSTVTNDALTWEEPVPAGMVRVKPAKGISITVEKGIAKRITIRKQTYEES